jgi:hypothetical protein
LDHQFTGWLAGWIKESQMIIEKQENHRKLIMQDFAEQNWDPEPSINMVELCPYWVAAAAIFIATVISLVVYGFVYAP